MTVSKLSYTWHWNACCMTYPFFNPNVNPTAKPTTIATITNAIPKKKHHLVLLLPNHCLSIHPFVPSPGGPSPPAALTTPFSPSLSLPVSLYLGGNCCVPYGGGSLPSLSASARILSRSS